MQLFGEIESVNEPQSLRAHQVSEQELAYGHLPQLLRSRVSIEESAILGSDSVNPIACLLRLV